MHVNRPARSRRSFGLRLLPLPIAGIAIPAMASGPTLVPSGGTVTLPSGANIGSLLQFGTGGGGDATLSITGGGAQVFSGGWAINGSNAVFNLSPGVTLVMQPQRAGGVILSPSDVVLSGGGTLILGPGSNLAGWASALSVRGGSTLDIGDRSWLTSATRLTLGSDGTDSTLRYRDDRVATFAGVLDVGTAVGGVSTLDVSSGTRPAGMLTFSGSVQGTSDLKVVNSAGLASPTEVVLAFSQGSYAGSLVLDGARVQLANARGIGTDGIEVAALSALTIAGSMTAGASQSLEMQDDLELKGATGTQHLTWNGDIDTDANTLTIENMQLSVAPTSILSGAGGTVELASGGILSLNGATAAQRIIGNGGLLSGPGTVQELGNAQGFRGTIQLGDGATAGTLRTVGNASVANAFIEALLFPGTGTADKLEAGALLDGLGQASVDLIYDATVAGGPLVPANGTSQDYTIASATVLAGGTPAELALTTIDPLTGQYSVQQLDPSNPNTTASGAQFEWVATPGAGGTAVLRITGAPNPAITVPGTTQTNIGTVNNTQLTSAVTQISSIVHRTGQPTDAQYVGSTLLLLSPQVLPGAVVTAAVPANPDALPNTTFNSMSQAGQVARLRLLQLREGGLGDAAARATGGDSLGAPSAAADTGSYACSIVEQSPGSDAVSQQLAVDAGINGASPREGARLWARGYGFYEDVSGQSYAQGDYKASMGGMMVGADTALDAGLLAGAFVGFTPGKLSIQSTLGNTQTSLLGVNFGGYASWAPESGSCYLQGTAMAGYSDADQSRYVEIPGIQRVATSSAGVWGATVGGEGGLNLRIGEGAVLQPYLGLEYGYYTRDGYSESGVGALDLTVSSQDANRLQPTAGARAMQTFAVGKDRLTPFVGAAFVAQVPLGSWSESATNGFSGAQVFTFGEGADDQYGASFQAGVEFAAARGWTAYISFNGMAMTDTTVYGGQIGMNIAF